MARLSPKTRRLFEDYGRQGGVKRSQFLSGLERSLIARKAAEVRWGKRSKAPLMRSIRLNQSTLSHPVFLEELLTEGSLDDWKILHHEITDHPFGVSAVALKKVLLSTKIYGVNPLWMGILRSAQGTFS